MSQPSEPQLLNPPPEIGNWGEFLRRNNIKRGDFMEAFATLGVLAFLDEQDASQALDDGTQGGLQTLNHTWREAWLQGGSLALIQWLDDYRNRLSTWPFESTAQLRVKMPLLGFSGRGPVAISVAAELLCGIMVEGASIRKGFAKAWFSLLLDHRGWEHRPGEAREELTEPLRAWITRNVHYSRGQSVLVFLTGQNVLLWELLDSMEMHGLVNDASNPTPSTPISITVVTNQQQTGVYAWATLLARGVFNPDVRLEAPNQLQSTSSYDWIIVIPPFGLNMPTRQEELPVVTQRGEFAVIQRAYALLRPNGHLIALMPRSLALLRQTDATELRQWLLKSTRMSVVMEIPAKVGFETVGVSSLLLFTQKSEPAERFFFLSEAFMRKLFDECNTGDRRSSGMEVVADWLVPVREMGWESMRGAKLEALLPEWEEFLELVRNGRTKVEKGESRLHRLGAGIVNVSDIQWRQYGLCYPYLDDSYDRLLVNLQSLAQQNPQLYVRKLGQVASVFAGVSYRKEQTIASGSRGGNEHNLDPFLVRLSDLPERKGSFFELPEIRQPQLRLLKNSGPYIWPDKYLRPWDILVSRTGMVGKLAVYQPHDHEKGPALASSQIIVVRPREPFEIKSSRHLIGILVSSAGREWLNGLVRGTGIANLRVDDLISMPVVDADAKDSLLLDRIGEHLIAGHPLETTVSVLADRTADDPTIQFFSRSKALRDYVSPSVSLKSKEGQSALLGLCLDLEDWMLSVPGGVRDSFPRGRFQAWWSKVFRAILQLLNAAKTEDSRDQIARLLFWQRQFLEMLAGLKLGLSSSRFPMEDSTAPVTDEMTKDVVHHFGNGLLSQLKGDAEALIQGLLDSVSVTATLMPSSVALGTPTVVTVGVSNQGSLSLSGVAVTMGVNKVDGQFLVPGHALEMPFTFSSEQVGIHPLTLAWSAVRLDNKPLNGRIELNLIVTPVREVSPAVQSNPYVDGASPVGKDGQMFFGRKDVLHRLNQALSRENRTTVLIIEGNRRIGKSSLLLYYRTKQLDLDRWLPVYINFQDFGGAKAKVSKKLVGIPDESIFRGMARELIKAASLAGVTINIVGVGEFEPGLSDGTRAKILFELKRFFALGDPFECLIFVLDSVLRSLGQKRVLLMFDEFDRIQAGIDSGVTSDQVPENLRHMLQTYPEVSAILTGSLRIRRLRQEYWHVLFNLGQNLQLRGLDDASARQLVTEPVMGYLSYVPAAVDLIVQLTGRQPLLIQILCGRLYDLCHDRSERLVTPSMVEDAAGEQVEDSENMANLWDFIESPRQRCLVMLLERLARDGQEVTPILLRDEAELEGIRYSSLKTFTSDLDSIKDLDVVASDVDNQIEYLRFEVPLFALWIRRHQDFAVQCAAVVESQTES
jgi:type I restriction enzyme M protein